MATILIPLPDHDFDPTETGVPWRTLRQRSHHVVFATPNGKGARADPRMITGEGLGIFAGLMKADANGRLAYEDMSECEEFRHPISYNDISPEGLDGLILPAPNNLAAGFTVRDGNYLSARWPGDAHRFSNEFASMLG